MVKEKTLRERFLFFSTLSGVAYAYFSESFPGSQIGRVVFYAHVGEEKLAVAVAIDGDVVASRAVVDMTCKKATEQLLRLIEAYKLKILYKHIES